MIIHVTRINIAAISSKPILIGFRYLIETFSRVHIIQKAMLTIEVFWQHIHLGIGVFEFVVAHKEGSVANDRALIGPIHVHVVNKRTCLLVILLKNGL
jgi:hypothetical protein